MRGIIIMNLHQLFLQYVPLNEAFDLYVIKFAVYRLSFYTAV